MSDRDEPKGIGIFDRPDYLVLAQDYGERGYSGIEIDSIDAGETRRLLKVNQKRLMQTWSTYAKPTWWRVRSRGSVETGVYDKAMSAAA